jgi:hypothetical protein
MKVQIYAQFCMLFVVYSFVFNYACGQYFSAADGHTFGRLGKRSSYLRAMLRLNNPDQKTLEQINHNLKNFYNNNDEYEKLDKLSMKRIFSKYGRRNSDDENQNALAAARFLRNLLLDNYDNEDESNYNLDSKDFDGNF